ncbi:hypothetical protein WICMUC_004582 [Wickerhamomyces mucosus]|uniref:Amino acid transporter transmembrane domain-containing protein n=1 Tax=Wickerhamomyces mucosus TaxID=1378264 RepID=A0A9P8PGY7_9ASCO|nr:hypothetical protein WICMUC_004582 [Wickerhamomyces mucosus]
MRHPKKYASAIDITFRITWLVDYLVGGLGYLMFGEEIEDQVTKYVIRRSGWLVQLSFGVLLGILPITKGALITRPIVTMIDQFTITQQEKSKGMEPKKSEFTIKFINRFLVILVFGICSFVFTNFGLIMSFLGSAICFAICLINPLGFYLKLYYKEISKLEIGLTIAGIAISFVLAVCGSIAVVISGISEN